MKITVESKIKIVIDDKEIKMTREEACNLRAALNFALGEIPQYPPVIVPAVGSATIPPVMYGDVTTGEYLMPEDSILTFTEGNLLDDFLNEIN